MLRATKEQEWWADQVVQVMVGGKRALDAAMLDIGRMVAETLMYIEREEKSGPDYHPTSPELGVVAPLWLRAKSASCGGRGMFDHEVSRAQGACAV